MRETAARPGGRCGVGGRRKGQTAGSRRQAAGATPWPLLVRRLDVQQLLLHWHSPTRRSPCCSAGLLHLPCCPHVRTAPGRERPSRARREQRRATSRYRGSTPSAQQPTLGVAPAGGGRASAQLALLTCACNSAAAKPKSVNFTMGFGRELSHFSQVSSQPISQLAGLRATSLRLNPLAFIFAYSSHERHTSQS